MKKSISIRTVELFILSIVLSSTVCFLCVQDVIPASGLLRDSVLTFLPIIYLILNALVLRRCYVVLVGDKIYYIMNVISTVIFITTSILTFVFFNGELYSWLFLVTGLGSFLNIRVPGIIAISTFHLLLFTSIFLAPIGLGWVKIKARERRELLERAPGILTVNPLEPKKEEPSSKENQTPENN